MAFWNEAEWLMSSHYIVSIFKNGPSLKATMVILITTTVDDSPRSKNYSVVTSLYTTLYSVVEDLNVQIIFQYFGRYLNRIHTGEALREIFRHPSENIRRESSCWRPPQPESRDQVGSLKATTGIQDNGLPSSLPDPDSNVYEYCTISSWCKILDTRPHLAITETFS